MIDRTTTIQTTIRQIEEQAQAIEKTALTVLDLPVGADDSARANEAIFAMRAKLEGIQCWAHQIWAECGLLNSADEYQQHKLADALAAAEPTAVDILGDADGVAGVESEDEYSVCGHCGKTLYDGPAGSDWDGRPLCDACNEVTRYGIDEGEID